MEIARTCSQFSQPITIFFGRWCGNRRDRKAFVAVSAVVALSLILKSLRNRAARRRLARKRKDKQKQQNEEISSLKHRLQYVSIPENFQTQWDEPEIFFIPLG